MAFVRNLFGSKPKTPETTSTDTIIPLFERDDSTTNRAVALEFTMVFEDVLDADKLSSTLWRLLEKPGWRKLGARLRLNKQGKLDYHVPATYTEDRPPFLYTHETVDTPFAQHPVGKKLPRPNGQLQVCDELGHLRVLTDVQSSLKKLEDWTNNDVGQLGLHITNLPDATFVTITWLHTLLDAMGRHALLRAWQAVLEGRDNDVPEFVGYDTNPLADIAKSDGPEEDHILAPKRLSPLGLARFGFNVLLWERYWYPKEEGRMIIVPNSYLTALKAQALKDCETLDESQITYTSSEPKKPFLSDGDVLTAWLIRLTARTNPEVLRSAPSRIVAISNIMGMRDIMRNTSPPLLPKKGAYIHNCISAAWSHFTVSDFLSKPLGHIAAQIRSDLVAQSTRAQIAAGQRVAQAMGAALYGTPDMVFANMTNWSKAKLFETDFGAAIVGGKKGKGSGKPRWIQPFAHVDFYSTRGSANCIGKDGDGNWWLGAVMRQEFVEGFEKEIKALAEKGLMEV